MKLHDSVIWSHVPRYSCTTRIFPLEGLSKFMSRNVFQRPSIVSTLRDYSEKSFQKNGRVSVDSPIYQKFGALPYSSFEEKHTFIYTSLSDGSL